METLVSIVIPIYNVEKYLKRCVENIINQTYKSLEIILVDDGSPDNCPDICDSYAQQDNRIMVIHKENGGLSDARNVGMDAATGKYIVFIDSDDFVELNMIEKALYTAQLYDSHVVIWGFFADYVDENERLLKSVIHSHPFGFYNKEKFRNIVVTKSLIGNLGYAWNKMYQLKFLKNNNLRFNKGLSLVEDIVFNSPVLSLSQKIVFLEEPLTHYIQRPRVTLGTQFYEDYFDLKKQGLNAVNQLLFNWNIDVLKISEIYASIGFESLKATIKILSCSSNLSLEQKKDYLDDILNDSVVSHISIGIELITIKDKTIYKLMKLKQSFLLLLIYKNFTKK